MRTQIQSKFRLVFSRCGSRGLATGMACATVLRTPTGHPSRPPSVSQRSQNRRSEVSWWRRRIASQVIWLERQDAELVRRKPAPIVRGAKAMDGELV